MEADGRAFYRALTLVDDYTRECLANEEDAPLFEEGGPCFSLDPAEMWGEFVPTVRAALIDALSDLNSPYRPHPAADARQAAHTIINWLVEVEQNPRTFLSTYSAQVHYADPASLLVMERLPDSGPAGRTREQQLAHFLLRANTAFEISKKIPYLPHSNRVLHALWKLGRFHQRADHSGPETGGGSGLQRSAGT